MYSTEEVALGVYLEVKGKYTRLSREGCVVAQTFQEQSCQSAYGEFGGGNKIVVKSVVILQYLLIKITNH